MNYEMLTFIISSLILLLAFVYDFYKNIEFRNEALYLVHEDVLSTSLALENDFQEKYPVFYGVVKTFEGKEFRRIFSDLNSIQKVPNKELIPLKKDMKKIVESGSDREKLILGWYFVTCDLIVEMKKSEHKVFKEERIKKEIFEENRKATVITDIDKLDSGVCYA
ncbi:hypothetical protein [Streptococcus porcorum]|uniref:Uncharacterized protein n=1 Tax=Streptococcus porcorum TaxID=701526 RepID=A0ABV2JG26_9STRE